MLYTVSKITAIAFVIVRWIESLLEIVFKSYIPTSLISTKFKANLLVLVLYNIYAPHIFGGNWWTENVVSNVRIDK